MCNNIHYFDGKSQFIEAFCVHTQISIYNIKTIPPPRSVVIYISNKKVNKKENLQAASVYTVFLITMAHFFKQLC